MKLAYNPTTGGLDPYPSNQVSEGLTGATSLANPIASANSVLFLRGWISGAIPTYNSSTQVGLTSGSADVNGTILTFSALTLSVSGIVAPQYMYLYDLGSGVAALEKSTTAPVWDSTLNYFKKTGDATRRCVGYVPFWNSAIPVFTVLVDQVTRLRRYLFQDQWSGNANAILFAYVDATANHWVAHDFSPLIPVNVMLARMQGFAVNLAAGTADLAFGFNSVVPTDTSLVNGAGEASIYSPLIPTGSFSPNVFGDISPASQSIYVATYTTDADNGNCVLYASIIGFTMQV
jgi:hypothetical protein